MALGILASVGSRLLGGSAARKAKQREEEALAAARQAVLGGYDEAGKQIDVGQQALESGYGAATTQRKDVAGQLGTIGQSTFNAQKDLWTPWTVPGLNAYQNLDKLLNDPSGYSQAMQQFSQSSQYQFQMQQAQEAVKRSAAATGNRMGGNQMAALSDRAGQVAGQNMGDWLNRLQSMASTGFAATGNLSNAQTALGNTQQQAAQYGDTSQWDLAKGKDLQAVAGLRGDMALNKASDLSGMALTQGNIGSRYNTQVGALNQGFLKDVTEQASAAGKGALKLFGG